MFKRIYCPYCEKKYIKRRYEISCISEYVTGGIFEVICPKGHRMFVEYCKNFGENVTVKNFDFNMRFKNKVVWQDKEKVKIRRK